MIEYEQNNFGKALELLRQSLLKEDSLNISTQFYLGISYIELDQFQEAEFCFKTILKSGNSFFKEQASWYLAMTFLGSEDQDVIPEVKNLLKQIEILDGDHTIQAKELLRKL